ncbi:MAG: PD40 domain-containing protein [Acidobacteria bacterium]|nr:PD40 domain-containing protein [Acidobacteriota bacterium]
MRLILAALLLLTPPQNGYEVFQKALTKERAEGKLSEAIELYRRTIQESVGNRSLIAKALVQIGHCYEKLGSAEARKAYEQVVREYGDQREAALEARTRLLALERPAPSPAMSTRLLWTGPVLDGFNAVSSDGRLLTFVDWETGDLAVIDLVTRLKRRITQKGSWLDSAETALYSAISYDGKHVAYTWENKEGRVELRIIGMDGSNMRVAFSKPEVDFIQPIEWTRDGKRILCLVRRIDGTKIGFYSVAGRDLRLIKTFTDWRHPGGIRLSPDDRIIAYDLPPNVDTRSGDIYLLWADGSREIPIISGPANDVVIGWTPDGAHLLFGSDRAGTVDLWSVRLDAAGPPPRPELIKRGYDPASPLGLTRNGTLFSLVQSSMQDVYVATLDEATGRVVEQPVGISLKPIGASQGPDWSPDGAYLAFRSGKMDTTPASAVIRIQNVKTGDERVLRPELNGIHVHGPRWAPDGKSMLVVGADTNGRYGVHQIDAQTGKSRPIVFKGEGAFIPQAAWSADGKSIFYVQGGRLIARNVATEEDHVLDTFRLPLSGSRIALSPSGRWLAYTAEDPSTAEIMIKVAGADGEDIREIAHIPKGRQIRGIAWTAGDKHILFAQSASPAVNGAGVSSIGELWRVAPDRGKVEKLDLAMERLEQIRLHPDGKRIAFTAGTWKAELWVLENFLPEAKGSK